MSGPRYLRAPQVAEELGLSIRTVRRWIANGSLRSIKIGGTRLVCEADLQRLLNADSFNPEDSAKDAYKQPRDQGLCGVREYSRSEDVPSTE